MTANHTHFHGAIQDGDQLGASIATDSPKHILLAEDNDANRIIAQAILERDGFIVTTAVDGRSAVVACVRQKFDAVLLDILMPVMDGMKTFRRIRALANGQQNIPIFALTAFCSPADQHRYRLAGFNGVLPKPLKSGQFKGLLSQFDQGIAPVILPTKHRQSDRFTDMPHLDEAVIRQLQDIDDPAALHSVQAKFWDSVERNLTCLEDNRDLVTKGDMAALGKFREAVHGIKGASATIGLSRAHNIARALQNAPPAEVAALLDTLEQSLRDSRDPLKAALG